MESKINLKYSTILDKQLSQLTGVEFDWERRKRTRDFIVTFSEKYLGQLEKIYDRYCSIFNANITDTIQIYFIPNFFGVKVPRGISDPCIICFESVKNNEIIPLEEERVFLTICHELAHIISCEPEISTDFFNKYKPLVKNHIVVYALMKLCFNEQLYLKEINNMSKFPAYKKASEVVEKIGAKEVINQILKK